MAWSGKWRRKKERKRMKNEERMTDNPIGDEGKKIVREAWGGRGELLL